MKSQEDIIARNRKKSNLKISSSGLPYMTMRHLLAQLEKDKELPEWTANRENMEFAKVILQRSNEKFYQFYPYINRRDGLPGWQWSFLEAIKGHKGRVALGANRIGKILAGFQTVRMADGTIKTMEDVKVGDFVLSYEIATGISRPTRVTNKWNHPDKDCYEITFSDGASVYAEGNHPFPVKLRSGSHYTYHGKREAVKVVRRTVNELIPRLGNAVSLRTRMLSPKNVEYLPIADLPIDPYALGVLLGDGSITTKAGLAIHSTDKCIIDRVGDRLNGLAQISPGKDPLRHGLVKAEGLAEALESLGLLGTNSGTKFIPDIYLAASEEQRRELLAGLIDTDGFLYGFTVKSYQLAKGFQQIVRSLGGKATMQVVEKTCTNAAGGPKTGMYYNVTWRAYDIPCELKYKLPEKTKRNCDYSNRIVRDIKPIGKHQCYCIEVEHKDHCFLIGDFVATCNTEMGAYECMLAVTGRHPYRDFPAQGEGWIVGLDFNMVKAVDLPKFRKFIPSSFKSHFSNRDNQPMYEIWNDTRRWTVRFKSSEAGREKFQGADIDFIWFDEEPKKIDIFSECETRLIDRSGVWWMTATPILGTIWLKEISERGDVYSNIRDGNSISMWDNPYLPWDEIESAAERWDEEERLVRVEGNYIVFGGRPVFNVVELTSLLEDVKNGPAAEFMELKTA